MKNRMIRSIVLCGKHTWKISGGIGTRIYVCYSRHLAIKAFLQEYALRCETI